MVCFARLLAAPLLLLLGASCGVSRPAGTLLVLTDPATRIGMERSRIGEEDLRELAARYGLSLTIAEAPDPQEAGPLLLGLLRQQQEPRSPQPPRQLRVLLLSPFPVDIEALSAEFPQAVFIRFSAGVGREGAPGPPGGIRISFDRREAFRKAGQAAAWLLSPPAKAGGFGPGGGAAVLVHNPTDEALAEIEAFREGFSQGGDPARLAVREIGRPEDLEANRAAVEELARGGTRLFLLKAYGANSSCLETIERLEAAAIVEDWQASRVRPQAVLLSIEPDYRQAIDAALAAGKAVSPASAPTRVQADVRLVRGGALNGLRLPSLSATGR